jgi:hypothetical protein
MSTDAIALVRRALAGERDALAQLAEAHQTQVCSLALTINVGLDGPRRQRRSPSADLIFADSDVSLAELPLPQRVASSLHYLEGSFHQHARAPLFDTVLSPSPRRNSRLIPVAA